MVDSAIRNIYNTVFCYTQGFAWGVGVGAAAVWFYVTAGLDPAVHEITAALM
jgi:hypothetical protein